MKKLIQIFLIPASLLLLSACGGDSGQSPAGSAAYNPLTPFPSDVPEPDEPQMRAAVQSWLAQESAPSSSTYKFERADLNGDGRKDALILFENPYGYWCDFNGCPMLILRAGGDDFSVVNKVEHVRGPLYISEITSHGWKTLIVHVSGRWSETKDVMMEFDGRRYPADPEKLAPVHVVNPYSGHRIFEK